MFSLTADYIMTDSPHWARAGHAELFESLTEWSSDVTDGVIVRTVSASPGEPDTNGCLVWLEE